MKKSLIKRYNYFFNLILLFTGTEIFAAKELAVALIPQYHTETCWAASCRMILKAYGYINTEKQVLDYATGGVEKGNYIYGTTTSCDRVYWYFGKISVTYDGGNLLFAHVKDQIDRGCPIHVRWEKLVDQNSGHHVEINGYTDDNKVIYNDPWPVNVGTARVIKSYAGFVQGPDWKWTHTLRMVTLPRAIIPTGSDDYVKISDGGTTTITPSTTSLTYTANFTNVGLPPSYPSSWNWKLIFTHSGGDCIASSWNSTSSNYQSTWSISNFSLPIGYQWNYNYDGKIPGRVELDLKDSDGSNHLDAVNVFYVPNNLYPGIIVYENNTISNIQPEVKAHELIITKNDQFLSGGNITFKSGERIDIKDGITIQNGSITNFTIDPSIR